MRVKFPFLHNILDTLIPDDALNTEKYISNEDLVNWFFDFSDEAHYQKALKVAREMNREREKKAGKK